MPTVAVAPILEPAGREAIEMEHVRRVAFAMLAGDIAAMKFSVSDDLFRWYDVPRLERRAELLKDFCAHLSLTGPAGQHGYARS